MLTILKHLCFFGKDGKVETFWQNDRDNYDLGDPGMSDDNRIEGTIRDQVKLG